MTNVYIISAPSGSGKSSLVRGVRAIVSGLIFSVSYTTRARVRRAEWPRIFFCVAPRI